MKTKTKFWIILVFFYTIGILALFSNCSGQVPEIQQRQRPPTDVRLASTQAPTPTVPEVATAVQLVAPLQTTGPVLVAVLVDFSASISFYGVEIPSLQAMLPVINLIDERGGELGVGAIQENPSTPLLRLRIPPPEKGLEPPDEAVNVFTRKRRLRAYRKALPEYEERERRRRAGNKILIEAYLPRLESFLSKPASAQTTDLWGNVNRANLMLMESALYWTGSSQTAPFRALILVTDGRHNAAASEFKRPDKSIIACAVSGSKGLGDLGKIRGISYFESTTASIYFVVAKAGGN